jgi:hypothetical protein
MRNDHVFYGHIGGRYPTADEIEVSMREARRLRSEAAYLLWRDLRERLAGLVRRRPAAKLQAC